MNEQAQTVDASTAHLKGHIRMEAATASITDKISLKMVSSIMKFVLSGLPADAGILQHLTWAAEGASQTKLCHLNLAGCVLTNGKLTAYLAFVSTEMSIKQGGKLTVTLTGSKKVFQAVMTIADGMTYTAGKQYTTSLDGTNTPWQMMTSSMAFTVRVDDTQGLDFNIPFPGKERTNDVLALYELKTRARCEAEEAGVVTEHSVFPLSIGFSFITKQMNVWILKMKYHSYKEWKLNCEDYIWEFQLCKDDETGDVFAVRPLRLPSGKIACCMFAPFSFKEYSGFHPLAENNNTTRIRIGIFSVTGMPFFFLLSKANVMFLLIFIIGCI